MVVTKITVYRKHHYQHGQETEDIYFHFWPEEGKEVFRIFADIDRAKNNKIKLETRWIPIEEGHYPSSTRQARFKMKKSVPVTEEDYRMLVAMIFGGTL